MSTASVVVPASARSDDASTRPRLSEITRSFHPLVWLASAVYRLTAGDPLPVRVIFARAPKLIIPHLLLVGACEYAMKLDRRTRALARVLGSRINNCMFCDDLETRLALEHKAVTPGEIDALPHWRTSDLFSARDKAAFEYIDDLNTVKNTTDETFAELRRHFSEREIVELTWLNAVGNYLNLQAKPFRLAPEGTCEIPRKPGAA